MFEAVGLAVSIVIIVVSSLSILFAIRAARQSEQHAIREAVQQSEIAEIQRLRQPEIAEIQRLAERIALLWQRWSDLHEITEVQRTEGQVEETERALREQRKALQEMEPLLVRLANIFDAVGVELPGHYKELLRYMSFRE